MYERPVEDPEVAWRAAFEAGTGEVSSVSKARLVQMSNEYFFGIVQGPLFFRSHTLDIP